MQDGSLPGGGSSSGGIGGTKPNEKALLARIWGDFDTKYMKPLLTHSRPTLLETLPVCCSPLARILTTTQQMTQVLYRPNVENFILKLTIIHVYHLRCLYYIVTT